MSVLEGLDATHAAQVLQISAAAYRNRLSRARSRLRSLVDAPEHADTPTPSPLSLVCSQES